MNTLRRALGAVSLVWFLLAPQASATSYGTDQSDLWFIPAESGWGMQLVQRGEVIFATLFVYGPNTSPTWYTATMDPAGTSIEWTGTLYATTGPWFGTMPFNPSLVTLTPVGTMTWMQTGISTGTLNYTINGLAVIKNVVRQTLVLDDFSGTYLGSAQEQVDGCAGPGSLTLVVAYIVTQVGSTITIQSTEQTLNSSAVLNSCTYSGPLTQFGQMGAIQGAGFSCSDGSTGTISFAELQVTHYTISGSFAATYSSPPGCLSNGSFGAGRIVLP
jgi:hypothetical protein